LTPPYRLKSAKPIKKFGFFPLLCYKGYFFRILWKVLDFEAFLIYKIGTQTRIQQELAVPVCSGP